jgi:hypothetical protein
MVWGFRWGMDMNYALGERADRELGELAIVTPHMTDRGIQGNRQLYSQDSFSVREIDQRIIRVVVIIF